MREEKREDVRELFDCALMEDCTETAADLSEADEDRLRTEELREEEADDLELEAEVGVEEEEMRIDEEEDVEVVHTGRDSKNTENRSIFP